MYSEAVDVESISECFAVAHDQEWDRYKRDRHKCQETVAPTQSQRSIHVKSDQWKERATDGTNNGDCRQRRCSIYHVAVYQVEVDGHESDEVSLEVCQLCFSTYLKSSPSKYIPKPIIAMPIMGTIHWTRYCAVQP